MNIKTQKLNNLVKRVLYERSILLESAPCNNDWDCADNKWCGSHPPCEARACAYGSRGACACIRTDCGGPDRIADEPIITTQGGVDKTDVDVKMDNDRKMMGENTNTRLNESQLLNERYTCWHRKGGMIDTQLHSCGRHTCGTGDWNIPGHRNEYGSRFECNGKPGQPSSGFEDNSRTEYNPTVNYRKGGSPKSKYWKLPKWLSEDIDKRVMIERSSTMLNENIICGDRNNQPCESRSCPKSVGATWRPTYVTNSCNCKAPGGAHCGSVAPGTGPIDREYDREYDIEYGNGDIWVGTEYDREVHR